jgi:transcriptional regulator with XRE-family HTH domain
VERQARKLTQRGLAQEARLSVTYVGEVERGERMVSLDTIARLATALSLTSAELLARARL